MMSSECITWLAVFLTMSVAVYVSNSETYLSIVLFIKKKNRSLPTSAKLYLVIKLTIVDITVCRRIFSLFYVYPSYATL